MLKTSEYSVGLISYVNLFEKHLRRRKWFEFVFAIVVNLKRIERVKNERGRDRALLNTNPTK